MTEKQQNIVSVLNRTICTFNNNEQHLLVNNLSERCICAKFAMYLDRAMRRSPFKGYFVDVEYNRGMGGNDYAKKIIKNSHATLDLIVHKRGTVISKDHMGYDNLFAIEMKKTGRSFSADKERLQLLVNNYYEYCYRASFAVRIVTNKQKGIYKLVIEQEYYNAVDF